ncbi:hypothetical protein BG005_009916 [Podila minutissima]|nr:hypothetical protein BG005_009916 [Podila minutissima]
MARGPKKHLKRLNAPKHWMLDKLTGTYVCFVTKYPFTGSRESQGTDTITTN